MKKFFSAFLSLMLAVSTSQAALLSTIPLVTGPNDPTQMNSLFNTLIPQINNNFYVLGSSPSAGANLPQTLIGSVHMPKLEASATPTVCFIGDSTVSQAINYVAPIDSQISKIKAALQEEFPTKTFTFLDYSIPGTYLPQFTTVVAPSPYPPWYTNHAATWNSYVAALGCTSLVISFGINDPGQDTAAVWKTALTAIAAYSTIPDIIISTNVVANANGGFPFNLGTSQAGYVSNAAMSRTLALSGNTLGISGLPRLGLIDIGRYFNMAVLGRDPVTQYLTYSVNPANPLLLGVTTDHTFSYQFPATDGDFDLILSMNNGAAQPGANVVIDIGFFDSYGLAGSGVGVGHVTFTPTGGTGCTTNAYYSNSTTNVAGSSTTWSATTNTVEVSFQAGHLQVYCNGALTTDKIMPSMETPFTPYLFISPPAPNTTVTAASYAVGKMQSFLPSIDTGLCYGNLTGPNGGNNMNHVSSACLNQIYGSVISKAFSTP